MHVHIIMHESFEAPAAIELWAQKKGCRITYSRIYEGDTYPASVDDIDFLVVMGGPQSPATTLQECSYFDSEKEIAFIKSAILAGKKVFGACLGAQLIGEALGAKFEHSPNREIGVFDIMLTEKGEKDEFFSTLPKKFGVGHWHGDMPGLTTDSVIIATSEGCPRQIVKYSPFVWGFQCHFEFTQEAIEGMIQNSTHELERYKNLPYIEQSDVLRAHDYSEMNEYLYRFLDWLNTEK